MQATYSDNMLIFKPDYLGVYALTEQSKTIPSHVLGDINDDTAVDIADALLIARYDAGLTELADAQLACSDVNGDEETDIADALLIARYDAGLIDSLE